MMTPRAAFVSLLSLCLLAASLPQASPTLFNLGACSSARITKARIIDWQQRLFFTSNVLNYPGGGASGLRGWAMVTLAMFDAANLADNSKFASYLDFSDLPSTINVNRAEPLAAAAKAAQVVLDSLIPATTAAGTATQLRYTHLAQFQTHINGLSDNTRTRNGIALGQYVGQKMVQNRTGDGHPPNDCNSWPNPPTPACPNFVVNATTYDLYSYNYPFFPGSPQSPGYPLVRPFGVNSYADPRFAVPAPPAFDSPAFLSQWQQLFGYGTSRSGQSTRTTDTDNIAKFHNGNFGSTISFATDVLSSADSITIDGVDLLRILSLAALSSHDSHAIHWRYKYIHNRARPITAYRFVPESVPSLFGYQDASWTPLLTTSQTPEYPSGHASRTSGATAAFIKAFGDSVYGGFKSISVSDPGQGARSYNSFSQFQEEVQVSRIYGGVHWAVSGNAGRTIGEAVVNYVWPRLLIPQGSGHYFWDDDDN